MTVQNVVGNCRKDSNDRFWWGEVHLSGESKISEQAHRIMRFMFAFPLFAAILYLHTADAIGFDLLATLGNVLALNGSNPAEPSDLHDYISVSVYSNATCTGPLLIKLAYDMSRCLDISRLLNANSSNNAVLATARGYCDDVGRIHYVFSRTNEECVAKSGADVRLFSWEGA